MRPYLNDASAAAFKKRRLSSVVRKIIGKIQEIVRLLISVRAPVRGVHKENAYGGDAAQPAENGCVSQDAIMRAFDDNAKVLHRTVAGMIGDTETAHDIVQAAFVKVWNYGKTQPINHPKALFFKAARNLARDELRRRSRLRDQNIFVDDPEETPAFNDLPSQEKTPEEMVLLRQEANDILQAIERLPLKNRRALKQHRFQGLTYLEISKKMDVSQSSVEKYIIEALKQLRLCQKTT